MSSFGNQLSTGNSRRWQELILPIGVICCLFIVFVPLPAAMMDVLLAANISIAVIILLTTLYVRTPLEFSVFPSLLLVTTLARLSLNVATTRLILTNGATDLEASAGQLIQSFGEFVAGDQIAIGLVIFSIIVIIQFVVITKGATRISEVTARFALDGMPGRQMSIDADLNAGIIDSSEAQFQRQQLTKNADFFGAMDGASKFVRGDAIAGILITLINIAGGLIVGLTANMSIAEAAGVFTKLTIGDGLASQIPALFTSIAAAMLVTRPTTNSNLNSDSFRQLSGRPVVLIITAVFLLAMIFTSLPKIPLLGLAAVFLFGAWSLRNQIAPDLQDVSNPRRKESTPEVTIERLLGNEILEMELGIELIPLADPKTGGKLLPAVTAIRKNLAASLGVILPKIRIKDNLQLAPKEYRILVQGNPVDIGTIFHDCLLATDEGKASGPISGAIATESTDFGQAFWIPTDHQDDAQRLGYKVQGPTSVLTDRMNEVADRYASDLLTRDATNQLIEETRKTSPAIVDELLPNLVSLKQLQSILRQLVSEHVSIRPLGLILETIADVYSDGQPEFWVLVEKIRQRLAPQITARHLGNNHAIKAVTIESELQNRILEKTRFNGNSVEIGFNANLKNALVDALRSAAENQKSTGGNPIVCVAQEIRPAISRLANDNEIDLKVLGAGEIVGTYVESVGEISMDALHRNTAAA